MAAWASKGTAGSARVQGGSGGRRGLALGCIDPHSEHDWDRRPIGSFTVMEKRQRRTGQVVGATDELQLPAEPIRAHSNGTMPAGRRSTPKHARKALRRYLGIESTADSPRFPFHDTEDLPLCSWNG